LKPLKECYTVWEHDPGGQYFTTKEAYHITGVAVICTAQHHTTNGKWSRTR